MKAYFYSFGCKVNQYETQNIKQRFQKNGYIITNDYRECGVCILNTCTVTATADKKCRQLIHKIKKENPKCVLVLTGCFPQAFENEAEEIHEADIITGASNKNEILSLVDEFFRNRKRIMRIPAHVKQEKFESMSNNNYPEKTRAYVKIQDGCNQYCSYCIIPYSRGFARSKPLDELIPEVRQLSEAGHKEIILVGINLSCYGIDTNSSLIEAIEAVSKIDKVKRVRLGSLEPELISDDDIKRMAALKKLCPQFHLSLQSGCDRTLREMNRKYTSSEYFELVKKLRSVFEDCSVTTDVMVGFPGESEEDFEASLAFVKKCGFSKAHVFSYSIRKGTAAAKLKNQLSPELKESRAHKMNEIATASQKTFLEAQIGKTVEVLFERNISGGFFKGYTPNYTLVKINAEKCGIDLRKRIFCVKILECENDCCIGEVLL